jgi:hypothetical protein
VTNPDPRVQADTALGQLGAAVHEAVDAAPRAARSEARSEVRRWLPLLVLINLLATVALVLVAVDQSGAISELEAAAVQAKPAGDRANEELQARGQQPVPIPEPGTGADLDVIIQTATARVLASLPDTRPTDGQVGAAVARYLADHPAGPTLAQVSRALADYLAANPPPAPSPGPAGPSGAPGAPCDPTVIPECRGPQGDQGPRGEDAPPPTAEEIQAAVADYIRANPDALCPLGGRFALARVQLAGGGSADAWTCVVTEYPAPTTTTEPTTTTTTTGGPLPVPLGGG